MTSQPGKFFKAVTLPQKHATQISYSCKYLQWQILGIHNSKRLRQFPTMRSPWRLEKEDNMVRNKKMYFSKKIRFKSWWTLVAKVYPQKIRHIRHLSLKPKNWTVTKSIFGMVAFPSVLPGFFEQVLDPTLLGTRFTK